MADQSQADDFIADQSKVDYFTAVLAWEVVKRESVLFPEKERRSQNSSFIFFF